MRGVDDADLDRAGLLMQDARNMGVQPTWPEAIQRATNGGTGLADLQRVVEGSADGGAIMRQFMSQRPGQVRAAGNQQIGLLAPGPQPDAVRTGLAAQRVAADSVSEVETAINTATRPYYRAAEPQTLDPARFAPIGASPAFQVGLRELRNDEILGPRFANMPDNSIAVIDEVTKRVRDMGTVAGRRGENFRAGVIGDAARDVRTAARTANPDYDTALTMQSHARRDILDPVQQGPLGRIAETNDVRSQTGALFPDRPPANMDANVADAVHRMAQRDPDAAAALLRNHAATLFSENTARLTGGANEFGGAKFSAALIGNEQQARNLEAGIRALPDGDMRWTGFRRFLDVMETTGERQRIGSRTSFNTELVGDLKRGGLVGEAASATTTGGLSLVPRLREAYQRYRLGEGTEQLARLFTDPAALPDLRGLLRAPRGSPNELLFAGRLTAIAAQGANSGNLPARPIP